jgi:CubicO group peptidase (beta-lactamase class C family)
MIHKNQYMKPVRLLLTVFSVILVLQSCKKGTPVNNSPIAPSTMYFPSTGSASWETVDPALYNWNTTSLNDLYTYLESKHTKGFVILKNGRIAAEKYFGTFTADSAWYWASAGKTLSAFLVGIAQQDGLININNPSRQYLGAGWSSMTAAQENAVTVKHHLTMTTGVEDDQSGEDCTAPSCFTYKATPGTRWSYSNAAYYKVIDVVENASGKAYNTYTQEKLYSKTGMTGVWLAGVGGNGKIHYSTVRSMARFGLLLLNKGAWNGTALLNDQTYFNQMINTSQNSNLSYGYLTWLNGKASSMLPASQLTYNGSLVPNAPADMYAAMGKNDQRIYVVPSQNIVVIRMGDASGLSVYALSSFDDELWAKLKLLFKY